SVFKFSEKYKQFISKAKTEREAVSVLKKEAEDNGFVDLFAASNLPEKFFAVNDQKNIFLFRQGKKDIENGINFVFAHLDSPRIDIKQNPLYEGFDISMLRTHYYGGVKKYQWVSTPLALHGVVVLKDGTKLELNVGEEQNDPVFVISDLLPHLAKKQMEQNAREFIAAEALDPIVGTMPFADDKEKERFKVNVLSILNEKYGLVEEDFLSSELTLVPAGSAYDVGFDRSALLAYGHDDRICSYTSAEALFDLEQGDKAAAVLLLDKEEIGSDGKTGAQSDFLQYVLEHYLVLSGKDRSLSREILYRSSAISADVNAALDPLYRDVFEEQNAAIFGRGIAVTKVTGSGGKYGASDASAELVFAVRKLLNDNKVPWQMAELGKVDAGGGGTVAKFMAMRGISTIDAGPALLSMHAPFEIASKADTYSSYLAYKAFLEKFAF
ncbi:MAG: aminopeptidase, partial [Caldisericaceae bacterium]